MKLFEIPMLVTSLFGLCLFSGLETPSAYADFTFGEPVNLGPVVNSPSQDATPCISADGLSLFFSSNRPGGAGSADIWVSTRETTDDEWGEPVNLGSPVNIFSAEGRPSISADGLTLFFTDSTWYEYVRRPGGKGGPDLWMTTRATLGDPWGEPVNMSELNSSSSDQDPSISADGLTLFFNSNRGGSSDIWMTTRATTADRWGEAVRLGPNVNSGWYECGPCISADGLILFFDSTRLSGGGCLDIFMSKRKTLSAPFGPATKLNIVGTCQGRTSVSFDGRTLYYESLWNSRIGSGLEELWEVPILPVVDFDGAGIVDMTDFCRLAQYWSQSEPLCDIGAPPWGDDTVDAADLKVLTDYWVQDVEYPHHPRLAGNPKPADGYVTDVEKALPLSWTPAETAGQHDVYLGTDPMGVEDGDISDTSGVYRGRQDANSYTPPEGAESGQNYYWRIDEFNTDGTIGKGKVWSFTVAEYLILDDMESYADMPTSATIYHTWIDALGYQYPAPGHAGNGTGALVGYWDLPSAEVSIVHTGFQSMPFFYENDGTILEGTELEKSGLPFHSEAQREWQLPQDWTRQNVEILVLWFHGDPANAVEPFYIVLQDSTANSALVVHTDSSVIAENTWQEWRIALTDFTGVNLKAIKKMSIGVGDRASSQPGGSGVLYIDDIQLHRPLAQ